MSINKKLLLSKEKRSIQNSAYLHPSDSTSEIQPPDIQNSNIEGKILKILKITYKKTKNHRISH